jgi:hypothetical protein
VVGAKVTLDNSLTSVSDSEGYALFKNVPIGKHKVKAIVNGKELSQIIDVKGVSTEAQSFSIEPTAKTATSSYIKYIAIALGILVTLLILYLLFRKLRKPKDPHMIGAPIISGTMKDGSGPASPIVGSAQTSYGPPAAGTIITPDTIPKQVDVDKVSGNE